MNKKLPLVFIVSFLFGFIFLGCPGTGPDDETKTFTVTIGTLTNGTISANPTNGVAGTEITLTVSPEGTYQLKAGTLRYGTTAINETTKKFNLPAENVTVMAEFEKIPIVPTTLQGTYRFTTGDFANNPEYDIVITENTLTWSGEGPYVVKSVTETNITIIMEEEIEFPVEYELSGNILRLRDGRGGWHERQKIIKK
jgi:hypothetical protein